MKLPVLLDKWISQPLSLSFPVWPQKLGKWVASEGREGWWCRQGWCLLCSHFSNYSGTPPKTSGFCSLGSQQELQRPLQDYSCWQSWIEALSRPRSTSVCSDTDGVPGGSWAGAKSCSYSLWNWSTYLCPPPLGMPFYHLLFLPRGQWEAHPASTKGFAEKGNAPISEGTCSNWKRKDRVQKNETTDWSTLCHRYEEKEMLALELRRGEEQWGKDRHSPVLAPE